MTTIRPVTFDDAEGISSIYRPIVEKTAISFERHPPSSNEIKDRITEKTPAYPWIVCDHQDTVVGYAYTGTFRGRESYQWSVETTVYVHPEYYRNGIGRGLYEALFAVLAEQGYCTAYAATTIPNPGSVGLHANAGFEEIGVFPSVGYKLDGWHDVKFWGRQLKPYPSYPDPPEPTTKIDQEKLRALLEQGLTLITLT